MTLSDYIREIGPRTFAERFGITERAALSYMYGDRCPRPGLAREIVENTPVDWEGVYVRRQKAG